ncbi:SDR family oxidoreductase [Aliiglaciecola sp. M165]|uniref:SDR family oxidoreductase n=1 Tax=Aliiglaciecola sp. M165 TaxID=2593649 RepID=UPI00118014A2|nr:SDR family oxidoreductase [Aliiglaciecola sp. M165]TRY32826.1 SDR family oxidoreductase [Aliiglaciecola sp. M165]
MNITIIGGGWLGQPLAKRLIEAGHDVVATKRSVDGVNALQAQGIESQCYQLGDDLASPEVVSLLSSDVLIINIPPGRKSYEPFVFINNMQALVSEAQMCGTSHVIFVSTTAVYGNQSRTVYEYSETDAATTSAKAHVEIEKHLRKVFSDQACILRLAGLVSEDRHPARSLSGRQNIENGQQVVNLVHRKDVINAIQAICENEIYGHTLHLCAIEHPTRANYYSDAAEKMGLPLPSFRPTTSEEAGKSINCEFTLKTLGLNLEFSSPYDML